MPGKTDKTLVSRYANPAFYNSPPASSLPIPKFIQRLWSHQSGSDVRLTPGTSDSRLDVFTSRLDVITSRLDDVTPILQAPPNSEVFNTKSEPVSVTSETKSPDAKTAMSATKEHDKPIDMVRDNPSRCYITPCLIHHVQKPEATLTASVQQRVAFDDPEKHLREASERLWHRNSEMEKLRRRQQAIIDQVGSQTTNITLLYAPQARVETQTQNSAIPANIQRAALQICMDQLIQATAQRAVEALEEYKRSTDHLQQVTIRMLERNLAEQRDIEQEESLGEEDIRLTSSSNEDD